MGLKISNIIIKKDISFKDLKNKKIAIDSSNVIYQFLSNIRQPDGTPLADENGNITSHLVGLFSRTLNLMDKGIKLAYVFDGKPPILKIKERERREQIKYNAEEELKKAMEEGKEEDILKYSKRMIRLTPEIVKESKELISSLGLPVIQAPSEAEAQAAFMCERNDVYAAASQDFDSLLFGAPRVIQNLTLSQKRKVRDQKYILINPQMIDLNENLKYLKINQDQLIILAILMGTDYNIGGIKGIGPKTALKLVQQNKNFDNLFKDLKVDFDWKRIYATFKSMPIMKNYQLKWNEPNVDKIKELLVGKHNFSEERVDNALSKILKRDKNQEGLNKWV